MSPQRSISETVMTLTDNQGLKHPLSISKHFRKRDEHQIKGVLTLGHDALSTSSYSRLISCVFS